MADEKRFKDFDTHAEETVEWLKRELLSIQTGRATPAVLDTVRVEAYGSQMPIDQVAGVTVEDPKTLLIAPWDASLVKAIETALRDADLGLGISVGDKGVRLSFPELTTENREKYKKMVGQKHEEARVSIRQRRDEVWNEIQEKEKAGEITEDEKFRLKEEMEERVAQVYKKFDELVAKKGADITGS